MSIGGYIKETRAEMKHVSWPTKKQAVVFSVVVVGLSLVTAAFLGAFDILFSLGVDKLLIIFAA
ncbi:MAG: preprotein translocase subunit SecE [Candidatus Taylorbacteria bacterium RIFCSPLOWO2_12_FULL_47_20]|uniref:Protein translocase subunit SecE n=2 Tax=Candidatus Tayloriibacteriota TaxID=1817919 RepID=A0A1G2PB84_9BACT|nr:MAG: preprotein translocase subunit SecE [Candidatus Taylorbacteria bacterium RIFCSPLOWO2_02_FULL_46_40]OHA45595.1 MAG: preprotein translocase subunit SecE [Candidatus Taylorbacteria bacterium RIFCSPLOWO2_12_FULL_47_20]